jgi:hypothetical protein
MVRSTVWRPPPRRVTGPDAAGPSQLPARSVQWRRRRRLRLSEAASEELARHNGADNVDYRARSGVPCQQPLSRMAGQRQPTDPVPNRFAADSALEGAGFEPSVPP